MKILEKYEEHPIRTILLLLTIAIILSCIKTKIVNAKGINVTPNACYGYYSTGNTNVRGTVGNTSNYGTTATTCTANSSQIFNATRYDFNGINGGYTSGYGTVQFSIWVGTQQSTGVLLTSGGLDYACKIDTGVIQPYGTGNGTQYNRIMYNVKCENVPIDGYRSYTIRIYHYQSLANTGDNTTNLAWISKTISIYKDESSESIINSDTANQDSKTNIDNTSYENAHQIEQNLLNTAQYDPNTINITYDRNGAIWIWNTITSIFNSNALIMTCVLAILSIGIMKQVLGR